MAEILNVFILFYFIYFILNLFIHERHREKERERQRDRQAPCREPNMGLDPVTPGSRPGPKAGAKPLSHPGCPYIASLKLNPRSQDECSFGCCCCLRHFEIFILNIYLGCDDSLSHLLCLICPIN